MATKTIALLIGGPPGGGKTTLSLALAGRIGAQSLTIDDIRTALLAMTTPESHPELHVIGLPDPWTYFTETKPAEMIEHAIAQHASLWPGLARVMEKREATGATLVVDGWHLMPSLVARSGLKGVAPIWLDVAAEVLERRERAVWDFYAKSGDPEQMLANFLSRSITWNDLMRDEAIGFGFRTISQDGSRSVDDLVADVLSGTEMGDDAVGDS